MKDFLSAFSKLPQVDSTANELQLVGTKIHWQGLVGSSRSICASQVAKQAPGNHLFILEDKEQAAYFLNDLQGLYPKDTTVLFYPASYRVPYEIEKTDNANVVSRAEVLEKISNTKNTWVITYPKALFERIPSEKNLTKSTLKLEVGKSYSIDFINETLLDLEFDRVDFVYEPGQFSIRGGIVDVFSYSNDQPFRIEFFGDDVESVRTFDASTQLSINEHKFFHIVPNVQGGLMQEENVSFIDFIGNTTTVWLSSYDQTLNALELEYKKAVKVFDGLESEVKHTIPSELFYHPEDFKKNVEGMTIC